MFSNIQKYQNREITHQKNISIQDWNIKLYTITPHSSFQSKEILKNIITKIPVFLKHPMQSTLDVYNIAFLIVHEGKDGIWIIFNWWTGGEMIESKLLYTDYDSPYKMIPPPTLEGNNLVCVWELEIISHERKAWINHVLTKAENPNTQSYLKDVLNK